MTVQPAGRGPQLLGVVGFFLSLTTITILLRSYCRAFVVKSFGRDDWLAIIAYILYVLFCAFSFAGIYHGTGQHAADIKPPSEIPIGLKWWWACEPVYVLSNMALKLSIGFMLLRLAVKEIHKIVIWVVLGVTETYSAFFFFVFVLQCRPSSYFWTQYTGGTGSCVNPKFTVDATYGYSAIMCLGDWILAILPMFMVWKLQMNPRTKISVALILSLGAIASTATIVRIPYLSSFSNTSDFLYATTDVAIWSFTETGLGIAACSAATLRPLFRAFLSRSRLFGGSTSQQASNQWPGRVGPSAGYIRSKGESRVEAIGLRADLGKGTGVTTIIESDADLEVGMQKGVKRTGSERGLREASQWSNSETRLSPETSSLEEERDWAGGIRKTTVQKQVVT